MTEKISVIISVYNTKKYLKKCLESIIVDDYKELEILVIDDHSEESSFDLIKKINDKRIKYIYKEKNVGLSIIKQYGLDIAKGKYVIFIDSDDYIEKNSIKRMYDNIKKYKADISICDMVYVYPNKMYKFTKNKVVKLFNRKEAMKALYLDRGITFSLSNKLFKKELFKGLYINDIKLAEDNNIIYKVFDRVNKVVYDPFGGYYYVQRKDSVSHQSKIDNYRIKSNKKAISFLEKKYPETYSYGINIYILSLMGAYSRTSDNKYYEEIKKYKKSMKFSALSFERKIQFIILIINKKLYLKVMNKYYSYVNKRYN